MSTILIDIGVGCVIFVAGIVFTIRRFGSNDSIPFIVVGLLTPFLMVFAVFRLAYLALLGRARMTPCPPGLQEAESFVELQRQQMFGGPLRQPSFTASWQRFYSLELQSETDRVQRVARRFTDAAIAK